MALLLAMYITLFKVLYIVPHFKIFFIFFVMNIFTSVPSKEYDTFYLLVHFMHIKICYSSEAVPPPVTESPSTRKTRSHKEMTDEDFEALPAENIDWEEMGSDNRELLREWSRRKEQEFMDTATQCQHANAISPIGRDRFFRTYWVFRSIPGLFVEESSHEFPMSEPSGRSDSTQSGIFTEESIPEFPASRNSGGSRSDEDPMNDLLNNITLAQLRPRWSVYGSAEEVDRVLEGLV